MAKKLDRIEVRVSQSEKSKILKIASSLNLPVSQLIRQAVINGVPTAPPVKSKIDSEAVLQLIRIGNNVNQIARYLNRGGEPTQVEGLHEIAAELRELKKATK